MKTFIEKIILLVLLVLFGQLMLYAIKGGDRAFLPINLQNFRNTISLKPTIIFFGDSVNRNVSRTDTDKRSISTLFALQIPGKNVGTVQHAAFQMSVYRSFLQNMVRRHEHLELVVIPVNLRSFSVGWQKRPEWQFVKEKMLLRFDNRIFRSLFKPLAVLKAFPLTPISEEQYEAMPVMDGDKHAGPVRDFMGPRYETFSEELLKNKLIFNYMYNLTPTNDFLLEMIKIARLAKKNHIPIIFYITPIDYETGNAKLGPRFSQRVSSNVETIQRRMAEEGVTVLDLSLSLPRDRFCWKQDLYPNEHLNDIGRKFVADRIAQSLPIGNY